MDFTQALQVFISLYAELNQAGLDAKKQRLLERQLNDIRKILPPGLPEMVAEQLGPSAVGEMQSDEGMRARQLQSLGDIQHIVNSGGLDLSDQASIEEALNSAWNQQQRARAGVASGMEQRGQMNSGLRAVMDTEAASRGANTARQNALDVGGMAARRRIQAIQDSAKMAGGMREQDWREKESSARAKDIRDEKNAAYRDSANRYNVGLPQQNFANQMAHATGQMPATSAVGNAYSEQGANVRGAAAGAVGALGAIKPAYGDSGGGYTYSTAPSHESTHSDTSNSHDDEDEDEGEH